MFVQNVYNYFLMNVGKNYFAKHGVYISLLKLKCLLYCLLFFAK